MQNIEKFFRDTPGIQPERRAYFRQFFSGIPAEQENQIHRVTVKKGGYVLKAGTPCDAVYFLLRGKVVGEFYTTGGKAHSFMDFSQMHTLGDHELFCGEEEYAASLCAEKDCVLLKMPAKSYMDWVQKDANALNMRVRNILAVMSLERKIDREYLQKGGRERLNLLLIRFYENGTKDAKGVLLVRNTQTELADKIGINVRSVQRCVAALVQEGYVTLKKGKMTLNREQYEKLKQSMDE